MRALIQRVKSASVTVEKKMVGKINHGLLIFLGIRKSDSEKEVKFLVDKCLNLRIFSDEDDKMNLSLLDVKGELLVVSQFTLYGDCRKGRRPSFSEASRPDHSQPLYEHFLKLAKESGVKVESGVFGADMAVELINDGPVTLLAEKEAE